MRLFKRRQVIYDWTTNFAHTYVNDPGPYIDQDFLWHCPGDGYLRLTGINFNFYAVPGIRGLTRLEFFLYHTNFLRYYIILIMPTMSTGDHIISMTPNLLPGGTGSGVSGYPRPLPQPTRMIPGDFFRLYPFSPLVGDLFKDITITYDFYRFT